MHPIQWQAFIEPFSQLSQRQRLAGIVLIEQTMQTSLHCPSCKEDHLARKLAQGHHGKFSTPDGDIALNKGHAHKVQGAGRYAGVQTKS